MDISDLFGGMSSFMPNIQQNTQAIQQQSEDAFSISDVDGSGSLNEQEFEDFNELMQEAMGSVAYPGMEGMADTSELYNSLDGDESGELSLEEIGENRPPMSGGIPGVGGVGASEEEDEEEDLLAELMEQMQQTLLDMMDSANNVDDDESTDSITSLLNQSNVQEYLNQAGNAAESAQAGNSGTPSVSVVA